MSDSSVESHVVAPAARRVRKWIAGGAAVAVVASMLVVGGIGVQKALADQPAPAVEATVAAGSSPVVAGEDGQVHVTFRNNTHAHPYNLSAGLVAPEQLTVTAFGSLGAPSATYAAGDVLPGAYVASPAPTDSCAAVGLEFLSDRCVVPQGKQYLVFENISDLPEDSYNQATLTVRPNAEVFEPGAELPLTFSAYTSSDVSMIPVFPGSSSIAEDAGHTSGAGTADATLRIEALRLEKSEPSPEGELLRGVHDHQTVYTLRIYHTGEGDVDNAKVVDYLPAGLEYLGNGQKDNTTLANGTGHDGENDAWEYEGSGPISGTQPGKWRSEASVETVRGAINAEGEFVGDESGAVFTKITWDLETLLAEKGTAQNFPDSEGKAGYIEIQYLAGIPLFENTMDFAGGDQPTTDNGREQIANLDNNNGPSTRHGENGDPWEATAWTNTASVSGDYTLKHPADPDSRNYASSASDSEQVQAMDVRMLKSVSDAQFEHDKIVTYSLDVATSEYVNASLDIAESSGATRPNRLVDDMGDGICAVFPADVPITPGVGIDDSTPNLVIGNPNPGDGPWNPGGESHQTKMSAVDWNKALGVAAGECAWPSDRSGAALTASDGASPSESKDVSLSGIAYNPENGHFYLDLAIDSLGKNDRTVVSYTAVQNRSYTTDDGESGGTSAGDVVRNHAETLMTTTPTDETADLQNSHDHGVGEKMKVYDDSDVEVQAIESSLKKSVLPRSAAAVDADEITAVDSWEDEQAKEPFIAGDQTWYKIVLDTPERTDTRNPQLSDFLPVGTELDGNELIPGSNYVVAPRSLAGIAGGECVAEEADAAEWIARYVGNPDVTGRNIQWNLGSTDCVPGNDEDRFLPVGAKIDFYLKVRITDASAFGTADLPQNKAKFTSERRIGEESQIEIYFERDDAGIELASTPALVKGIAENTFEGIEVPDGYVGESSGGNPQTNVNCQGEEASAPDYPAGSGQPEKPNAFGSNCDGEIAVQGDKITFRLDVTAPVGSTPGITSDNYVIWDALPDGVTAADVLQDEGDYFGKLVTVTEERVSTDPEVWMPDIREDELPDDATVDFKVLDPGETGYDELNLQEAYEGRSIILWTLKGIEMEGSVAPSSEDAHDGETHGFSLFYTLQVPAGLADGGDPALLSQAYENNASIIEFDVRNNVEPEAWQTLVPYGAGGLRDNVSKEAVIGADKYVIPNAHTFDDSGFKLPNAAMQKSLVKTEITPASDSNAGTVTDPNNAIDQIVQGEYATYDISVQIPAHTTVREGVLADNGVLERVRQGAMTPNSADYRVATATVTQPTDLDVNVVEEDPDAPDPDSFIFNTKTGKLIFPEYYTTGDTDQTFTVQLKVWMRDTDASNSTQSDNRPNVANGTILQNTAIFDSKNLANDDNTQLTDTAEVTYIEPAPTLVKDVLENGEPVAGSPASAGASGTVTYRLTAGNQSGRPALFDAYVQDCLPAGLTVDDEQFGDSVEVEVDEDACSAEGTGEGTRVDISGTDGTLITWTIGRLDSGAENQQTLEFEAQVIDTAGGGSTYRNSAQITGYTLPKDLSEAQERRGDRVTGASKDVAVAEAVLEKSVLSPDPAEAPVGDTVTYGLKVTLPTHANFYGVQLTDTLPAGVEYVEGTSAVELAGWDDEGDEPQVGVSEDGAEHEPTQSGQDLEWKITPDTIKLQATTERTITITFDARITSDVADSATFVSNNAKFSWYLVENHGGDEPRESTDDARVDLLDPELGIVKNVKFDEEGASEWREAVEGNPDRVLNYRLTVDNDNGETAAYHVAVTDEVPEGVIVDEASISDDGKLTGADATTGGGTITWQLDGPVAIDGSIELTYNAVFAPSEVLGADAEGRGVGLVNTAEVTHYESFPRDEDEPGEASGREYDPEDVEDTAEAAPLFPHVVPTKTVTNPVTDEDYGLAYAGEPFNWTLTIENEGQGTAKDVTVTDTLPKNWEYVPGSAKISIDGAAPIELDDPTTGVEGAQQVLLWDASAIRNVEASPLDADSAFVITFDAVPQTGALEDAGTGIDVHPHVNTLSATATDTQGAGENADGGYVGDDSEATAYIAEADLKLTKTAASDPITAGTFGAGWTLKVENLGPDTAEGPIKVSDTTGPLPAGISLGQPIGEGWTCDLPVRDTETGVTNFECERTNRDESLAKDATFPDITVPVEVAADQPATSVENAAIVVPGDTYDPNYIEDPDNPVYEKQNNWSEDSLETDTSADLAIEKTLSDPASPEIPRVGDTITWQLTARNLGPSVSQSTTENRITITDTVPAGMTGVTATSNANWEATLANGEAIPEEGVDAGTTIKWTYVGDAMPVGESPAVMLTGKILTSHVGDIDNLAFVHPGVTEDPDYVSEPEDPEYDEQNNRDGATTETNSTTRLGITKTRVIWNGTEWVQPDPATAPYVAGDPISYRVTVENHGPADAQGVTVVDETPTGLSNPRLEPGAAVGTWTQSEGGTTSEGTNEAWVTFTLSGTQQPGPENNTSFVVTYDTDATLTTEVDNWVEVQAENWDPADPGGNYDRDDHNTGSSRIVDLGIVKTHDEENSLIPGTTVDYQLVVTNHGPSVTEGAIEIEDTLPAGLSYVSDSTTITTTSEVTVPTDAGPALSGEDNRVLSWSLGDDEETLAVGETITITFQALIDQKVRQSATLENIATVDGPEEEPDPDTEHPNRDTDEIVAAGTSATMTIDKQITDGTLVAGENVVYTLTVENEGPSAVPASVTESLPAGLSLKSMSGTDWNCTLATATCTYLDAADTNPGTNVLHPVGTSTIVVEATIASNVPAGTELDNVATLRWADGDGTHEDTDNASFEVLTVADLGVEKQVLEAPASSTWVDANTDETAATATAGEGTQYRLLIGNEGPSDAVAPLIVSDELPEGATFGGIVGANDWEAEYDAASNVVTFKNEDHGLAVDAAPLEIVYTVTFDDDLAAGAVLTNTAKLGEETLENNSDPNSDNDTDPAKVKVERQVDLGITKTHDADIVRVGDELPFSINVSNYGPSVASGIVVTDTIPAGLEVLSSAGDEANGWTIVSVTPDEGGTTAVVAARVDVTEELAVGSSLPALTINTLVTADAYATVTNVAEVDSNEPEPDPDEEHPNRVEDEVTVPPMVTLLTEKTAYGQFKVGELGNYTIRVQNVGPTADPGPITVTDRLPDGLSYESSPSLPEGVTVEVADGAVTWTLENGLGLDEVIELQLRVHVLQAAYDAPNHEVTNAVVVETPSEVTADSVLVDDATVTVKPADALVITGGELAAGILAAIALLLLAGGGIYLAGRKRQEAKHG